MPPLYIGMNITNKTKCLELAETNSISVIPLGGVGKIGLNWTLYASENDLFLVDAGIGFTENGEPGDFTLPDSEWLRSISPHISAVVLTHAHEDHIGAIHRLWPEILNCPVYATSYCAGIIRERLKEVDTLDMVEIREYGPGVMNIGSFTVEAVPVSHSVPQSMALAIRAKSITILHTGDWKDDPNPLIGEPTDWNRLRQIGKEGVDLLVCDSTNALRELELTSEKDVLKAFRYIMSEKTGMVVVSCFGSNVARVSSAVTAAYESGRHAAIIGRSMKTGESVARGLGMLETIPEFLWHPNHLKALDRNEMALVCTGTQGEENAALWRLAREEISYPKIIPGDTVIISARAIPGKEEGINALIEALEYLGAEVFTADDDIGENGKIHVTGHAGISEILKMHHVIEPAAILPVHGNTEHLLAHENLAKKAGIPCIVPLAGDIINVNCIRTKKVGSLKPTIAVYERSVQFNARQHTY